MAAAAKKRAQKRQKAKSKAKKKPNAKPKKKAATKSKGTGKKKQTSAARNKGKRPVKSVSRRPAVKGRKKQPRPIGAAGLSTASKKEVGVARELLALERRYQTGSLNERENARWSSLVQELFGRDAAHPRRSFRLKAGTRAYLRIRDGSFACQVTEISHLGLTVAADVFRHIAPDEIVEVSSVVVGSEPVPLGISCTIARLAVVGRPAIAGLSIQEENSSALRQRFFDRVYYPLYIRYLEQLASAA